LKFYDTDITAVCGSENWELVKSLGVIDRKYPIEKVAEAFRYVRTGQKIGNVVITMDA
jgi:hypothetical protein